MKALIDATIHDTPIGQCVVIPAPTLPWRLTCLGSDCHHLASAIETGSPLCQWCPGDAYEFVGDVLAVVETCGGCNGHGWIGDLVPGTSLLAVNGCKSQDCDGYIRRGFVRVLKVLPVVGDTDPYPGDNYITVGSHRWIVRWSVSSEPNYTNHDLPASPGDVVLVVERTVCPYTDACGDSEHCPCSRPPYVTHRDGVLGEIGDGSGDR